MSWTRQEIQLLKQEFPTKTDREVARALNTSPNAIRIKASRLGISKEITKIRNNLELNPIEEQIIVGGLLGDLSCRVTHTSKNAQLEGGHCAKQKQYMLWKLSLLKRLLFTFRKTKVNTYLYTSRSFKALNKYHYCFYNKGFKYINKEILDLLNEFGLLIWYLDDGTYHKRDKNIRLYTNGFSYNEQLTIKKWFQLKYNIDPSIHTVRKKEYPGKFWYFLYFTVKDSKKLLNLFKNFEIPECMHYKLGMHIPPPFK